jgi:hypothetical protein
MILLNIDFRITQVRPRVEKSVQRAAPTMLKFAHLCVVSCAVLSTSGGTPYISADTSDATATGFRLLFSKHFARKEVIILQY